MVVFTCNYCGDSLQKPKVAKHYAFSCKNDVKSLTCVDCFKDFRAEEYILHTKCLTEDERYAAKGTFGKGIVKKGEVKQETWVEQLKSILDKESNMKPVYQNMLRSICVYPNVPRKKNKFVNFVKSSSGGWVNMKHIEELWNIIEKHTKTKQTESEKVESKSEESSNSDNIANVVKDLKNEENKIKKRKLSNEDTEDGSEKKNRKKVKNNIASVDNCEEELNESKKFSFQDKILDILIIKGSMSLKKLEKKVINAYLKETGETEITPKITKKFNKKLGKISNIEVGDDHVTLLATSNL